MGSCGYSEQDHFPVNSIPWLGGAGLGHPEQLSCVCNSSGNAYFLHFVREFTEPFELERKTFLSRPKLDGLWVRLRFRDEDVMEGIVGNNLLDLLDSGVQITPPDLHGNTLRMFVPRSALLEMKVLGVVGGARRLPPARPGTRVPAEQSKLFNE